MDSNRSATTGNKLRSLQAPDYDRGADFGSHGEADARRPASPVEGAGSSGSFDNATSGRYSSVIDKIYSEFAERRMKEKVGAWMWLQQELSKHAGELSPSSISLKDLTATLADIEIMLKGQQGDSGQSPAEYLEGWLSPEVIK
jgi:hypothetical protein